VEGQRQQRRRLTPGLGEPATPVAALRARQAVLGPGLFENTSAATGQDLAVIHDRLAASRLKAG